MAAKGLPDAVQKAILDATGYEEGKNVVVRGAVEAATAVEKFAKVLRDTQETLNRSRSFSEDAARGWERQAAGLDEFSQKMREAARANELFDQAQQKTLESTKRVFEGNQTLIDSLERLDAAHQKVTASAAERQVAEENIKDSLIDQIESTERAAVAAERLTVAHQRQNAVYRERLQLAGVIGRDVSAPVEFTTADRARLERAIQTVDSMPKPQVYAPQPPVVDTGIGYRERLTSGSVGLGLLSLIGAAGGGQHGIGAAGLLGALGLAAALRGTGAAGAVGGAMTGAFAGVTGSAGHDAAAISRIATGAVGRWWVPVHWATMLTNEILATVGPAIVAAGMGGLVGVQGGEQFVPRAKAIFNTAESLGGSLGITAGNAFGLKTATLQNAQDLATGNMFGLAGAATNILKAGAGGPFVQLGLDTNAMVARFAATLTQDFQTGGMGPKLGNLVTGGAGYLQQIGDVVANIGKTFANVAPNLPGVGGDLLSTLSGGTGALASLTGMAGGFLGPVLSFEAASRWGPPMMGMLGRTLGRFGRLPGLGGLGVASRAATAADVAAGTAGAVGDTIAGSGIAGAVSGLMPWQIGLAGAGAYLINKGYTYQTPESQIANQMVNQVNQLGVPAGIPQIISNMQQLARYPASGGGLGAMIAGSAFGNIGGGLLAADKGVGGGGLGQIWSGLVRATHGIIQLGRGAGGGLAGGVGNWQGPNGMLDPTGYEAAQAGINKLAQAFVFSLGTGNQVQAQWKSLTGQSIDMGKAFDVATMAQLQLGSSFQQNGHLTTQAKTMIQNLQTGYQAMNFSGGQFGNAVAAQTAMSGLQHTQLASVNSAWDQLTQMVTGGALSSATLFGLLGGAPVASTRGRAAGITLAAAGKGNRAFSGALGSFISPGGAAAWNTLTNPQGILPALEGQMNWLRTAQVMGSLSPDQTQAMAGFDIAQIMPRLGTNPAALAMLSTYAQEFGGPSFAPGTSGKTMARALRAWVSGTGGLTGSGFNRLTTLGTEGMSGAGADAQQFVQQVGSGIAGALAKGLAQHGADLQNAFASSIVDKGGKVGFNLGALENYGKFLAGAGVPKQGAIDMARYVAQLSGAGPHLQSEITSQLSGLYAKLKVQADTSQAQAAIHNLEHVTQQPKVTVKAEVAAAQAAIDSIKGKNVPVSVRQQGAAAVQAAIDSIHGKNVTVTITTINRIITQAVGAGLINTTGGFSLAGTGAPGMRIMPGHASGYRVPGYGGGDIHPALLEGGEAVVPKHLVDAVAPFLSLHNVPGFASGGFVGEQTYGAGTYWGLGSRMALWNPAMYAQILAAMRASQGQGIGGFPRVPGALIAGGSFLPPGMFPHFPDPTNTNAVGGAGKPHVAAFNKIVDQMNKEISHAGLGLIFAKTLTDSVREAVKQMGPHATAAAKELLKKITTEIQYGQNVRDAMKQGLNLGGMDVTPGTGNGTVQEQMQSYLSSMKSFSKDLTALHKGGLSKDLMKQIVAAGPVQGDALAQSILQGPGGIKQANQLNAQINKLATSIGGQAALMQYGTLAPNAKSVTTNVVNINVSIGGSGGGNLSQLTESQLKQLMQKIQQELLKQAKKNNKTGIKAHGKGA